MTHELNVLVDIFWNHVRLGQWEFSSATALVIKDLSQEHYENLLLAVTLDPEKHRLVFLWFISIFLCIFEIYHLKYGLTYFYSASMLPYKVTFSRVLQNATDNFFSRYFLIFHLITMQTRIYLSTMLWNSLRKL